MYTYTQIYAANKKLVSLDEAYLGEAYKINKLLSKTSEQNRTILWV